MPRLKKKRCCRLLPNEKGFKLMGVKGQGLEKVELSPDEFEVIRLCDYEGKNQIEAAEIMQISRGTIQRIMKSARYKIVDAFLNDKIIIIKNTEEGKK
ncbi:RNA polymerase sigma factor (sigma-70 family) [Hypnocyclicus thermotrophus]|uniref:RNA polymerase sigma factor (Sigma-70 family) n=1 Tax=Hypnocyclicus thermotrophus TaxID=1627895 RepID=A0AA46I688_9FUSO|nr:DUF134 domain-containing protein [Hypnocyclicus thermotrophus]TDT71954.1 RNA polymerase sigma factor (sigma-70 family) [Hypnocyclicus thermotrophus]